MKWWMVTNTIILVVLLWYSVIVLRNAWRDKIDDDQDGGV